MVVRYKTVVASCAALLSGVVLAHFPISVDTVSDDGLLHVGWTPVQVGICSYRPFQLFSGDADVYGIAAGAAGSDLIATVNYHSSGSL